MNKIILSCPEMLSLRNRICDSLDFQVCDDVRVNWGSFNDGYPNTMLDDYKRIKGADVFFLANFEKKESLFDILSVLYALPHYGAKSLTVFLPYFPTATMERVARPGQIATAKTLMRMLDVIPSCHGSGPARLIVYDIHSLAVQHFHGDGIIVEIQSAIPIFLKKLEKERDRTQPSPQFAFPDEGSRKRFHTFFPDACIICTKDENRKVSIKEGAKLIPGADVIVIDDMVRNGDTLINCKDTLLNYGAVSVSAFVTHGVFPGETWQKFTSGFKKFWVTDSCISGRRLGTEKIVPFERVSLSSAIAAEISSYGK